LTGKETGGATKNPQQKNQHPGSFPEEATRWNRYKTFQAFGGYRVCQHEQTENRRKTTLRGREIVAFASELLKKKKTKMI